MTRLEPEYASAVDQINKKLPLCFYYTYSRKIFQYWSIAFVLMYTMIYINI